MGKGFVLNMGVGLPSPLLEVDKVFFNCGLTGTGIYPW